jgi:hypothetical protein
MDAMKMNTLGAAACALVLSGVTAAAQSNNPQVTTPSGQNSGAGIPGQPGNQSGPATQPGTVGSTAPTMQDNPTTRHQDPAGVKGLPGNKSGDPAKRPAPR